jgi:hypothetical protein
MTYVQTQLMTEARPIGGGAVGAAYNDMNELAAKLRHGVRARLFVLNSGYSSSLRTPLEQRLSKFQTAISDFSMYLPNGFAKGLNRQFANMFDKDAWETDDHLPTLRALQTFLTLLHTTQAERRPGIGTNGRGSITAFWKAGDSRLTVECYSDEQTNWALTRSVGDGKPALAAGECAVTDLHSHLRSYRPEVWFGH